MPTALLEAIEARNTKELSKLLKYIEQKRYVSHMPEDVNLARELLRSLDRIEKLRRAILNLDAALIAEIRRYSKPPKLVHEVMVASLLLLGDHEGKTRVSILRTTFPSFSVAAALFGRIGPSVRSYAIQLVHMVF